ncbi:MAG: hypothetical protein RI985_1357 [Chloroflexota bacterium]|jgi:hypothetical protein
MAERIGEIIESSTLQFTAGSYQLHEAPAFGSVVRVQTREPDVDIYALVYDVRTVSREPGGRAVIRGVSYTGETLQNEEIYRAHPDLAEVLQTEFSAWIVGYRRGQTVYHRVPAQTAPVHYSVYACTPDELQQFGQQFGYIGMVVHAQQLPVDELVGAVIRQIAVAHTPNERDYTVRAGRELASLLRDDFERLRQIVLRIRMN